MSLLNHEKNGPAACQRQLPHDSTSAGKHGARLDRQVRIFGWQAIDYIQLFLMATGRGFTGKVALRTGATPVT
jgi:hypothetical protein